MIIKLNVNQSVNKCSVVVVVLPPTRVEYCKSDVKLLKKGV